MFEELNIEPIVEILYESSDDEDETEVDQEFAIESEYDSNSEQSASSDNESINNDNDTLCTFGKNKHKWNNKPVKEECNLKHSTISYSPEVCGLAKAHTVLNPELAWRCLFTDETLYVIVKYTNQEIDRRKGKYLCPNEASFLSETNYQEVRAVLGLLYLAGVFKTVHESLEDLYANDGTGRDIFPATMTLKRLLFLLSCLRFDDKKTREERKRTNKFTAISEFFEQFILNCQANYSSSEYLTIDEMLIAFEGKCPFKMYLPSKLNKYGIRIMILADAKTHYLINAHVYTGKEDVLKRKKNFSVPAQHALKLVHPIEKTNRNVTGNNWFSSIELADELRNRGVTYVGTMKKDKKQIPPQFLPHKKKVIGSSVFGFNEHATLVSYTPKKNKSIILISTKHHTKSIDNESGKPEILRFYNMTKDTVDKLEQDISKYSTAQSTKWWPMVMFFAIMDIAAFNAYILQTKKENSEQITRRDFIISLGKSLIQSELKRRSLEKELPRELRHTIVKLTGVCNPRNEARDEPVDWIGKRRRCQSCPRGSDRKTGTYCEICKKPLCAGCTKRICPGCF